MNAKELVFAFWTDSTPIPLSRQECLKTMETVFQVPLIFITEDTLDAWVLPSYPLHPAYPYLSAVHKSDYLRCYFMHHYGGGYTDIKPYRDSWKYYFQQLNSSDAYILGYREIGPDGIARIDNIELYENMCKVWDKMIGCGNFICKPYTPFTTMWIEKLHSILDTHYSLLVINPAKTPRDHSNLIIDGVKSSYPLCWSELMGRIFHILVYNNLNKVLTTLPKFYY